MKIMLSRDAGNQSMFWSGLTALYGYFTLHEWVAIIGLLIGLISGAVNIYDKCQAGKIRQAQEARDKEIHELKKRHLTRGLRDEPEPIEYRR